jgi:hypothetical protein
MKKYWIILSALLLTGFAFDDSPEIERTTKSIPRAGIARILLRDSGELPWSFMA